MGECGKREAPNAGIATINPSTIGAKGDGSKHQIFLPPWNLYDGSGLDLLMVYPMNGLDLLMGLQT